MSLLEEATRIGLLADFQELPPDLRTLVIRRMTELVIRHHHELLARLRVDRAWEELGLGDPELQGQRIIE